MLKITFSDEEVQALQQARFQHAEARVRVKMEVLYLKSQDFAPQEIAADCRLVRHLHEHRAWLSQDLCSRWTDTTAK